MALLQGTDYIRVLENGDFEIYNSQEERELYKESPNIEDIIKKYDEILTEKREYFFKELQKDEDFTSKWPQLLDYEHYFIGMENIDDEGAAEAYIRAHKINNDKAMEERAVRNEQIDFLNTVYDREVSYEQFSKMEFPIIEQYFPTWYKTKIKPKVNGSFNLEGNSVDESYADIKRLGFFGETKDV